MSERNSVVAVYDTHIVAEQAVQALQRSSFDMTKLSIVGKGPQGNDDVVGYYSSGDRMLYWGFNGAFWGGMLGALCGSAFFVIPGIGPLLAAGPVVAWIMAVVEDAVVVSGLSVLGAGLYSIGISKTSIPEYENALKSGKFVLIAHGTPDEVLRVKGLLADSTLHLEADVASAVKV